MLDNANTINYEATITDPKTFSRPWKVSMPVTIATARKPRGCSNSSGAVRVTEELIYGDLQL